MGFSRKKDFAHLEYQRSTDNYLGIFNYSHSFSQIYIFPEIRQVLNKDKTVNGEFATIIFIFQLRLI